MYYLNCFFIYSILGFLYENIINIVKNNKIGSGILYGPWTPIYGVGCVLILVISKFIFNIFKINIILETIIILIIITIVLTFLEYLGGILIEKIFHITFWNYKKFKFNIGKYIALEVSLIWFIGSFLIIYIIQPLINKFIYLIPNYITYILLIIFIIDLTIIFITKKVYR